MYKILGGDGKEYGPISADTLRQWITEGRANAQSQVLPEGGAAWVALGTLPEFAVTFAPTPPGFGATPSLAPTMNILALVGFCLSVVSITIGLCCCYGFPFNIAGIICSFLGLRQVRAQPERYTGRGLAIAGIIVGAVSIVVGLLLLTLGVALNWADLKKDFGK
jgi:hypothetical protein